MISSDFFKVPTYLNKKIIFYNFLKTSDLNKCIVFIFSNFPYFLEKNWFSDIFCTFSSILTNTRNNLFAYEFDAFNIHHRSPYYYHYYRRTQWIYMVSKRPTRLRVPSPLIVIILYGSRHISLVIYCPAFNFGHGARLAVARCSDGEFEFVHTMYIYNN